MLYDKRWEKPEVKADPFKLESLVAWLEKQTASEKYSYMYDRCLLGQYFEANGFENITMGAAYVTHGPTLKDRMSVRLPVPFNSIAVNTPHNFGSALKRAQKFVRQNQCPQATGDGAGQCLITFNPTL
jgi:hypothetical protein